MLVTVWLWHEEKRCIFSSKFDLHVWQLLRMLSLMFRLFVLWDETVDNISFINNDTFKSLGLNFYQIYVPQLLAYARNTNWFYFLSFVICYKRKKKCKIAFVQQYNKFLMEIMHTCCNADLFLVENSSMFLQNHITEKRHEMISYNFGKWSSRNISFRNQNTSGGGGGGGGGYSLCEGDG